MMNGMSFNELEARIERIQEFLDEPVSIGADPGPYERASDELRELEAERARVRHFFRGPAPRTDVHRPSEIDPADYTYVGSFVNSPPVDEEGNPLVDDEMLPFAEPFGDGRTWVDLLSGDVSPDRPHLDMGTMQCDHCGSYLNYAAVYRHEPSGQFILTGGDCADNTMGLQDRRAVDAKRMKDAMAVARKNKEQEAERQKNLAETREQFPQAFAILDGYDGANSFIKDVSSRLAAYGRAARNDQTKVMRAIVNAHARDLEKARQIEDEEVEECPTGKGITIEGKVLKEEWKENDFGSRHVMVVKDDRGFAVWGSVPRGLTVHIYEEDGETVNHTRGIDQGDRVRFVANVDAAPPKKGEEISTFGFFKRPRKAEVLERAPEPAPEPESEPTEEETEAAERKEIEKAVLNIARTADDLIETPEDFWKVKKKYLGLIVRYWELGGNPEDIRLKEFEGEGK